MTPAKPILPAIYRLCAPLALASLNDALPEPSLNELDVSLLTVLYLSPEPLRTMAIMQGTGKRQYFPNFTDSMNRLIRVNAATRAQSSPSYVTYSITRHGRHLVQEICERMDKLTAEYMRTKAEDTKKPRTIPGLL